MKIPSGFKVLEDSPHSCMMIGKIHGVKYSVIITDRIEQDAKSWLHVSVASPNRMPDYNVMKFVKAVFMPKLLDAYEVHAKKSNHVNIHENCRHLWCCLDGDVLPDFTQGTGMI